MSVWLVFVEYGQYSDYQRTVEGVFSTQVLADAFAEEIGGEVEEWKVLVESPVKVTQYTWADRVTPTKLSPDWGTFKNFGRQRYESVTYEHLAIHSSKIVPWSMKGEPDTFGVEVTGTSLELVKEEHARLVAEARRRMSEQAGEGGEG